MKKLNEYLKTRPVHHKVKIMNLHTNEHKMLTEEEIRYVQIGIAKGILSAEDYCLIDVDCVKHYFAKDGRLKSSCTSNVFSYNDDLVMKLLYAKYEKNN